MNQRAIWVTGAGGLIGHYLVQTAPKYAPGATVAGLTRPQLDLADFPAVRQEFTRQRPQAIIHCAALSRSPDCQANPGLARKLNVEVTAFLAELAADIPFVFFSTDLVFDGKAGNYDESAVPNPLSVYAETKLEAEAVVLANPRHTVLRTSLNGGSSPTGDRGFNEQMRNAWRAGQSLTLFIDEFRCPIVAEVTARAVWEVVNQNATGLYHLAGAERLSRWEIGQLLAARTPEVASQMKPASYKVYQGAPRSPDTSLNCARIQKILSFPLPGLTQWLAENPQTPF
ncbi:MAG TPA: SDR family oxidoreductase [Clostridia bacterium]|nr:SDR family oxidoreductase [Clostridia bacterium]